MSLVNDERVEELLATEQKYNRLVVEVMNLRHAIRWACGEVPDGNDKWFSDIEAEQKPSRYLRNYWWRSHLRAVAGMKDDAA